MSKLLIFCVISVFCVGLVASQEVTAKKDGYDTKYDNINLEELLKNDRLRKNYVKCLLNEGPCTPDAQELKNSLPDAIATNCSKCTEKQRIGSEQVTHYLIDNQPEEWDQLGAIYDKDGEYKQNYIESKMRDQATESSASIADGKMEGEEDGNKFENGPKDETNDENKQE